MPGRRPGSSLGSNFRTREEDRLASPGWKLLEDLGAKKTEPPRGDRDRKGVSPCPPALQKVGDRTYPPQKNTWMRRGHIAPYVESGGVFPPKTPPPPKVPLWDTLSL